jgi:hypothetical protein
MPHIIGDSLEIRRISQYLRDYKAALLYMTDSYRTMWDDKWLCDYASCMLCCFVCYITGLKLVLNVMDRSEF